MNYKFISLWHSPTQSDFTTTFNYHFISLYLRTRTHKPTFFHIFQHSNLQHSLRTVHTLSFSLQRSLPNCHKLWTLLTPHLSRSTQSTAHIGPSNRKTIAGCLVSCRLEFVYYTAWVRTTTMRYNNIKGHPAAL